MREPTATGIDGDCAMRPSPEARRGDATVRSLRTRTRWRCIRTLHLAVRESDDARTMNASRQGVVMSPRTHATKSRSKPTPRGDTMVAEAIDRFGPPDVLKSHRLPVP